MGGIMRDIIGGTGITDTPITDTDITDTAVRWAQFDLRFVICD